MLIGGSTQASLQNLADAVNANPATAGTAYHASTTQNGEVRALTPGSTTLVFQARVPGLVGNRIPSTETMANGSFGSATLSGGTGSVDTALRAILSQGQPQAEIDQILRDLAYDSGRSLIAQLGNLATPRHGPWPGCQSATTPNPVVDHRPSKRWATLGNAALRHDPLGGCMDGGSFRSSVTTLGNAALRHDPLGGGVTTRQVANLLLLGAELLAGCGLSIRATGYGSIAPLAPSRPVVALRSCSASVRSPGPMHGAAGFRSTACSRASRKT